MRDPSEANGAIPTRKQQRERVRLENWVDEPIRINPPRGGEKTVPRQRSRGIKIKRVKGRGMSEMEFPRLAAFRFLTRRIPLRLRAVTSFFSRFDPMYSHC